MRLKFLERGVDVCISTKGPRCYPLLLQSAEQCCDPQAGVTALSDRPGAMGS